MVVTLIDYAEIANFWYLLAGFSIFLMIYTSFFGEQVVGSGGVDAKAWINIAGRTFQSSELVKIAFILTFAKHLDVLRKGSKLDHPLHVMLLGSATPWCPCSCARCRATRGRLSCFSPSSSP